MVNNSEIQDRLDLIKIISTSNDTLHSAKLLLDNFCHVQWHTIANFFDDLCNELEYRGYKITDRYDEQTITNIVFGGIQKRKICIEIEVSDERGYTYSIGSDPEDTLFFGLYSDDNKGKIKRIRSSISQNKTKINNLNFDDGWEFWCYFDVPEEDLIYLWDFKQTGTFNLIRKENRQKSIKKHLDNFEYVIGTLFT